jgi:hypothetical protein
MKRSRLAWYALGSLALAAGVLADTAGQKLILNGKVASSDVRMIDGSAYVKVTDVARALGMVVVKRQGGLEITKEGGANQVEGAVQGKTGDVLFDGKWRFQVQSLEAAESYKMKHRATTDFALYNAVADYDADTRTFTARDDRALVVIRCRAINGQESPQSLWLANSDTRTALADTKSESYPVIGYDIEESAPFKSKALLPGAGLEFVALFSVPEGTEVKDLVFTLRTIEDPGTDVRVTLGGE